MKKSTENDVVKSCLHLLRLHRVFAWRQNNQGLYDPAHKCFRTFRGLRGVADILGVLPGGKFLAVEVKRPGSGVLSQDQAAFLNAVRQAGGLAICISDVRNLEAALRAEGVM